MPGGTSLTRLRAVGAAIAVLLAANAATATSSATATPDACGLVPAASVARDLGLAHIHETPSSTPDTGSGGLITKCVVTAWSGSKSKARVAKGTRARLTIVTAGEDTGSPYAANWRAPGETGGYSKAGEADNRELTQSPVVGGIGRHVKFELWDHAHAYSLAFTNDGEHAIDAIWTGSEADPTGENAFGRSTYDFVSIVMVVGAHRPTFPAMNSIAKVAVPAFLGAAAFGPTPGG